LRLEKEKGESYIYIHGTGKAASGNEEELIEKELVALLLRNLNGTEIGNRKWRDEEDED